MYRLTLFLSLFVLSTAVCNAAGADVWPVGTAGCAGDSTSLSSPFGPRTLTSSPKHEGIDIAKPCGAYGTQVLAAQGGTVKEKGYTTYGGYTITILADDGYYYDYMHLVNDEDKKNDQTKKPTLINSQKLPIKVKTGQPIGWSDTTGTDSAHLHVQVYTKSGGTQSFINPLDVLPYNNSTPPTVSIQSPADGATLGIDGAVSKNCPTSGANAGKVCIKIHVTAPDKDIKNVVLTIDGKAAPGANYNFEGQKNNGVIFL